MPKDEINDTLFKRNKLKISFCFNFFSAEHFPIKSFIFEKISKFRNESIYGNNKKKYFILLIFYLSYYYFSFK